MAKKRQAARLDLRCHDWQKLALEEASDLVGESMSEFTMRAALARAEAVYRQAEVDPAKRFEELGRGAVVR